MKTINTSTDFKLTVILLCLTAVALLFVGAMAANEGATDQVYNYQLHH